MRQQPAEKFQLRPVNGQQAVFLVQVDGHPVPDGKQRTVWTSPFAAKAQTVCDALNNGLVTQINIAVMVARAHRERA